MSEEALQIAEKRKKETGKGESERYFPVTADFQRITRRDKRPSSMNNERSREKQ